MNGSLYESRLIRLEEEFYFANERLKALDQQLMAQQRQLDSLTRTASQLQTAIQEIRNLLDGDKGARQPAEIPPHHEPRLW